MTFETINLIFFVVGGLCMAAVIFVIAEYLNEE